jgi:endonuclease/exonuclease/phosphatase family metal-dependent hydrolase
MSFPRAISRHFCVIGFLLAACTSSPAFAEPGPLTSSSPAAEPATELAVVTYNIRYDNPADVPKGNGWAERRRPQVIALLRDSSADIFGLQEVLPSQYAELTAAFPDYASYGLPRDDGKTKGEMSPIFYRAARFTLVSAQTRWLSLTPDVPSKNWDAGLFRICTHVRLYDKVADRFLDVWNTHWDNRGAEARLESAKLMHRWATEAAASASKPGVILMGDLNCLPSAPPLIFLREHATWSEARTAPEAIITGIAGTFGSFYSKWTETPPQLDHILVTPPLKVIACDTLVRVIDERHPSDHHPVKGTLLWR